MLITVKGVHHPLLGELSAIVGPKYCSDEPSVRVAYSRDSSPAPSQTQGIVVRPGTTEEVQNIVKLANYAKTPIIPSGGRASLYGCPPGLPGKGIVVDMTRMRKILSLDEYNMVCTVEAGITLAEMDQACLQKGLFCHTAAQPYFSDTAGGQISGVLGAGTGLELGSAGWNGNHICGLKVVLPNGSVINTGGGPGTNINQKKTYAREPGGPDVTGMFIGDGGIFGIKTEATYRMYRRSKFYDGLAIIFPGLDEAWDYCWEISAIEPLPYIGLFIIPPTHTLVKMGLPEGVWMTMTTVKGNTEEEIKVKLDTIERVGNQFKGNIGKDAVSKGWVHDAVTGERHRDMGSFASLGVWTYLELMTPRDEVKECIRFIRHLHQDHLKALNVPFECNNGCTPVGSNQWIITSIIFLKGYDQRSMDIMYELWKRGIQEGVAHGWCPDANQGWGTIAQAKYWQPAYANYIRDMKKALDPNNIMNPGLWGLE